MYSRGPLLCLAVLFTFQSHNFYFYCAFEVVSEDGDMSVTAHVKCDGAGLFGKDVPGYDYSVGLYWTEVWDNDTVCLSIKVRTISRLITPSRQHCNTM